MQAIKRNAHYGTSLVYLFILDVATVFGADPFADVTKKTNEFREYLASDFAVAFCTLVAAIAFFALMINKLRIDWAMRIMGGAVGLGGVVKFVEWAMK